MLTIHVPLEEGFDDDNQEFVTTKSFKLELEHSLVSLSKWEMIYEKPFISPEHKTVDETMAYIKAMVLTPDVPDEIFDRMTQQQYDEIEAYISAKMTATWFSDSDDRKSNEVITSELIYYWLVALSIPFECQYWHLNRLLTLIRVCNLKNQPEKKIPKREWIQKRRDLNAERKARLGTRG